MKIEVKCRRCGKISDADKFVLDHFYKMMVCPECVKERKLSEQVKGHIKAQKEAKKEPEEKKAPGWDKEDEYLERAQKRVTDKTVKVERVDEERVRYKCHKCSYVFLINIVKKSPKTCPYCDSEIYKMTL